MLRTQIQFEEEDMRRLKKEAARRDCSVSAIVRESVRATLLEREESVATQAVMEVAGKYNSGVRDLSENHDAYLEDGW